MPESDDPESGDSAAAPMSALRRRTAKARAERAARLAETLRANIGRRKQQARAREQPEAPAPEADNPDKPGT